jgi:molybdopterin molybdotransferase
MAAMIDIEAALALIRQQLPASVALEVPLTESLGYVLAADVVSDIDAPPYDKSLVDGYAVRSSDLQVGGVCLKILEEIVAGQVPRQQVSPGCATRIMTGAPMPEGADAVVMLEHTQLDDLCSESVRIEADRAAPGQHVLRQAACLKRGDRVLSAGRRLQPIDLGILAEVGCARPSVFRKPRIASLQTGNELVPYATRPGPARIRNSNGSLLHALIQQAGGVPLDLGISADDESDLRANIERGLDADVLLVSGGVSTGVKDLVPEVLRAAGLRQVFHKVRMRPGKPLWFGVTSRADQTTLVFGLPGNPVSGLVCFLLFVSPVIASLSGRPAMAEWPPAQMARLKQDHPLRDPRPTLWPAICGCDASRRINSVQPLAWRGSADLMALGLANCLAFFAEGDRTHQAGEMIPVLPLESAYTAVP